MPWQMVLLEQSAMAWVSLEGGDEHVLYGIPMHHSHLPVFASPMALRKGAGGGLGLLKGAGP